MKRTIGIIAAVVVATLGVYFGYLEYRSRLVPEAVLPHVKNASLRLESSLSYELEPSHITYRELFDKLEKHVTELDSKVIDVRTLETPKNSTRMKPLLEYMKAVQDTLRAQESMYRKQLALSVAMESTEEAFRELRTTTSYGFDYARRAADRASERVTKANTEFGTARDAFRQSLERLDSVRKDLGSTSPTMLYDPQLPTRVIEKIKKSAGG